MVEVLYSGNTSTFNDLKMLNVLSIFLVMLGPFSNIFILVFVVKQLDVFPFNQ